MASQRWVLLETPHWDHFHRLVGHELAAWLSQNGHEVAYISAPLSPWHLLDRRRAPAIRERFSAEPPGGILRENGVYTLIPRTFLPVHARWPFDHSFCWQVSGRLCMPSLKGLLRKRGFLRPDVLCIHNLQLAGSLPFLQPKKLIYRIEDDLAEFKGIPKTLIQQEPGVIGCADLVTATAAALEDRALALGAKRTLLLGNGTRVARFRRPEQLPPKPAGFPKSSSTPVAVYIGALDWWFDQQLLRTVAKLLPDWRFILYGRASGDFSLISKLANVTMGGPLAPEKVPAALWHATAGIIPFKRVPLVESVFPLKLVEYLAAGLPTVATRWQELERLASPALLSDSAESFSSKLAAAALTPRESLVAWAEGYDWDGIFRRLISAIQEN